MWYIATEESEVMAKITVTHNAESSWMTETDVTKILSAGEELFAQKYLKMPEEIFVSFREDVFADKGGVLNLAVGQYRSTRLYVGPRDLTGRKKSYLQHIIFLHCKLLQSPRTYDRRALVKTLIHEYAHAVHAENTENWKKNYEKHLPWSERKEEIAADFEAATALEYIWCKVYQKRNRKRTTKKAQNWRKRFLHTPIPGRMNRL